MYEAFFGLREAPFDLSPNPHYLVLTEGHRDAIATIEYAIGTRKGMAALIGAAGSGKTTVIRTAIERLSQSIHPVYLSNPALTRGEFIEMLGVKFELSERAMQSKTVLLVELEDLLRRRHSAGETTVLIVDEAQSLSVSLLEEIRLLANIELNDEKLLSVILAGQPELATQLDNPSLSQLKQRIALWCELRPLTLDETAAYLVGRIRAADGVASKIFSSQAVRLIHKVSNGIPRLINVISDNALMAGYAAQLRPVTSQIVEDVCRDVRVRLG